MQKRTIDVLIVVSALLFIFALFLSAVFEPQIRLLHTLQALIYVAVIVLTWRHVKAGYGIGIFIAAFWNYISLFVTTFIRNGFENLRWLIEGQPMRNPETLLALVAATGHFGMIVFCAIGYARLPNKRWSDAAVLILSGAGAIAYFWLIIAFTGPQYLPLFRKAFHLS